MSVPGILLGNTIGVGKTLTTILAMDMVKGEPGFSKVVAPKTLCYQFCEIQSIQDAFKSSGCVPHHPAQFAC
jgi:hypothetical protein